MTPEATPALSLGMSTRAADAVVARFSPKPSPVTAVQVAMNAVLLAALMVVPSTSPTFLDKLILTAYVLVSGGAGAGWVYYPSQRLGA